MKRRAALAYSAMFIGILLLIPVSYLFAKDKLNNNNTENRELASFPVFSVSEFDKYPQGITDYVDDNFPYKNQAVSADGYLGYKFLNSSSNDDVVLGKDGWLFYKGEDGGEYLQYKRIKHYSEEQLEIMAMNLQELKQRAEDNGARFVLLIVPNKETIYPEYMPDNVGVADSTSNTDEFVDFIRANTDTEVIWLKSDLEKAKANLKNDGSLLYQKYDTHWNELGAYVGTKALLDTLSIDSLDFTDISYSETEVPSVDLANMLGISNRLIEKDKCFRIDSIKDDFEAITEETEGLLEYRNTNKDPRKIMFLRDSFTLQMKRFIADNFNYCYLQHHSQFDISQIDDVKPDIFVYEICERRLDVLLK